MSIEIRKDNLSSLAPLYQKYPGQCQPQEAYVELDCRGDGILSADFSGEIGNAVPVYYWHHLAVRWAIPSEASGASLVTLFEDANFLALCQQILDGFHERWDDHNHVGVFSEEALIASGKATALIEKEVELTDVWDVELWLFENNTLLGCWPVDIDLATAVENLEADAGSSVYLDGDIKDSLLKQALETFRTEPDLLGLVHVSALLGEEMITCMESDEWLIENLPLLTSE